MFKLKTPFLMKIRDCRKWVLCFRHFAWAWLSRLMNMINWQRMIKYLFIGGSSKVGFGTAIKNPIILSLIIALSMICVILSYMLLKRKCKDAQIGQKFRNACGRMCRWRRAVYVVSDTELENKAAPWLRRLMCLTLECL